MTTPRLQSEFVGTTELPWTPGEHRGPDVYETHIDFSSGNWTFTGVARDFTLFSAEVLNHLGLPFDPVALYWEENALPLTETPIALPAGRTVLAGLPPPLDATIYACPQQYASGLIRALDRMAVRRGVLYESVRQQLPIVDWPLLNKSSVAPPRPPTVSVSVYGVTSSTESVYWRQPNNPWTDAWALVRRTKTVKKR